MNKRNYQDDRIYRMVFFIFYPVNPVILINILYVFIQVALDINLGNSFL